MICQKLVQRRLKYAILVCFAVSSLSSHSRLVSLLAGGREPPMSSYEPHSVQSFLSWAVRLASDDKEILLAYASKDFKVLAYNCMLSLRKLNVKNAGILVLDDETVEYFRSRNIAAYNVANITQGIPHDVQLANTIVPASLDLSRLKNPSWSNRWNNPSMQRWAHWMLRHYLALLVLKEGYGVYQTDVDMVFLNNPFDWLDQGVDFEGQMQHWPAQNCLNLGIGHVAATAGGILHWETTNNLMRYLGDDPQSIENFQLIDPLMATVGTKETKACNAKFPNILCQYQSSPMVNYRIWSESILPMSFSYGNKIDDVNVTDIPVIGIHIHVRPSGNQEGKALLYMRFCKQLGIWYIPEDDPQTFELMAWET